MATAITDSYSIDRHECPICLDVFALPRQLPCLHSFCEQCLQDYITKKTSTTGKALDQFMCPVCREVTRPANKEKAVGEWASLFPHSPFPLVGKSKVERSCEVCVNKSDSSTNLATKFCVICEEFMCDNCAVCHQNMKVSKSHRMITTDERESNPENRLKFTEGFGFPEHDDEDIKYYCMGHETALCGTCLFHHHKACQDVLELKQSLPALLKKMNLQKMIEQMRKFEAHLKNFMEMNEENIGILESDIDSFSVEIGDIRKKMNAVLDDIEQMVKLESHKIYKEWLIAKQEQNHQCHSLVSAIRNSLALLETVGQYGSDTQIFLVNSKIVKQLQCYGDQIREKFERVDTIRIRLKLNSNMKAILSQDEIGLVTLVCQRDDKERHCTNLMVPLRKQMLELSNAVDVHCPSHENPRYEGIIQLPNGCIVLTDNRNKTYCMFDSSYNFISSYILPANPYDGMCLIGDNEVAITMPNTKIVQFLSIRDHSIIDTGTLKTKYKCCSVASMTREEILVSGPSGNLYSKKCYWSVITRNGDVKLHHEFDCQRTHWAYAALDTSKSRVYISVSGDHAVYCFGVTDGKQYFVYSSKDLNYPMAVAVDRDDNVYVVGYSSNNIHKLSPNLITLQIITSGVPEEPRGISFNDNRDGFFCYKSNEYETALLYTQVITTLKTWEKIDILICTGKIQTIIQINFKF